MITAMPRIAIATTTEHFGRALKLFGDVFAMPVADFSDSTVASLGAHVGMCQPDGGSNIELMAPATPGLPLSDAIQKTIDRRGEGFYALMLEAPDPNAEAEELIERSGVEHLLVRGSWLYAPWAENFVLTIRELAKTRPSLRVVDDQRGRPTDGRKLAEVSLELLEKGSRGVFHVTDGGECSWFELAALIAEVVNPDCRVEPCTSEEFPRPAPRPAYSVLDISATERVVGPLIPWEARVRDVLGRLEP